MSCEMGNVMTAVPFTLEPELEAFLGTSIIFKGETSWCLFYNKQGIRYFLNMNYFLNVNCFQIIFEL